MINMIAGNDLDDDAVILLYNYHRRKLNPQYFDDYTPGQLRNYQLVYEIVRTEMSSRGLNLKKDKARSRVKYLGKQTNDASQFNNNAVLPKGFESAYINR